MDSNNKPNTSRPEGTLGSNNAADIGSPKGHKENIGANNLRTEENRGKGHPRTFKNEEEFKTAFLEYLTSCEEKTSCLMLLDSVGVSGLQDKTSTIRKSITLTLIKRYSYY